jgi:uncharacterized membrane protein YphA (DoxX/SURF4 family)
VAAKKKRAARKPGPPPPGSLWAPKVGLAGLRVFAGVLFCGAAWWKLVLPGTSLGETIRAFAEREYVPLLERAIADPPYVFGWRLDWYAGLLESVMLPGNAPYVFGAAILFFEALLGVCLVLGAGVRLMGVLGALLMIGFGLAKRLPFITVSHGSNWYLCMMLLALAFTAAGRIWGLDARLQRRLPRWIS